MDCILSGRQHEAADRSYLRRLHSVYYDTSKKTVTEWNVGCEKCHGPTVHGASGSNNTYWPEMYTNMPIVDENRKQPYRDTPKPKVFGAASPFDPQMFATVNEFNEFKISQFDVAGWLSSLANKASEAIARIPAGKTAEYR